MRRPSAPDIARAAYVLDPAGFNLELINHNRAPG